MSSPTAVSLFDGIGGFPLALSRHGVETVAAVEIDKACREVTARQLAPHKQFTDVQEVTGDDLLRAGFGAENGIITAGWPCQGNSSAGFRRGLDDPRSGLWWEAVRILRETRARWFLGENVPGLLTLNRGFDFWVIKESLEELGYGLAWRVLDAQYFGIPQRRRRVFLVGCLGDGASPVEILLEPERRGGDSEANGEARSRDSRGATVSTLQGGGRRGYRVDAEAAAGGQLIVVPFPADGYNGSAGEPDSPMYALSTHSDHNRSLVCGPGVRRLTPRECERLQGFPDDWTAGQSDSARYRQLGNAVAVPVVEWIVRRLITTSSREGA